MEKAKNKIIQHLLRCILVIGVIASIPINGSSQTNVIIGTDSISQSIVPWSNYFFNSGSQMIYLASEIGLPAGGYIRKIGFYTQSTGLAPIDSVRIYLKHTTHTYLTEQLANDSDFTLVYKGNFPNIHTGWNNVVLEPRFYYNGTQNIQVLAVKYINPDHSYDNAYFRASYCGNTWNTYKTTYFMVDNHTWQEYGFLYYSNRPNIQLEVVSDTSCLDPTHLSASVINNSQVNLGWQAGSNETLWNLRYKKITDQSYVLISSINTNNYLLTNIDPTTSYIWNVQAVCNSTPGTWSVDQVFSSNTDKIESHTLNGINIFSFNNQIYLINNSKIMINEMEIFDLTGQKVAQHAINNCENQTISTSLSPGYYLTKISSAQNIGLYKLWIGQ